MVCAPVREIILELYRTGTQTMFYLTCTMISGVDLTHYGVSRAKGYMWMVVQCQLKLGSGEL